METISLGSVELVPCGPVAGAVPLTYGRDQGDLMKAEAKRLGAKSIDGYEAGSSYYVRIIDKDWRAKWYLLRDKL